MTHDVRKFLYSEIQYFCAFMNKRNLEETEKQDEEIATSHFPTTIFVPAAACYRLTLGIQISVTI